MRQRRLVETCCVEILFVGPKNNRCPCCFLADCAHFFQFVNFGTVGECHLVLSAVALDTHNQFFRQGVDDRHTNAVQTARLRVMLLAKLTARVQRGHNDFNTGQLKLGMLVYWHPAPVVFDFQRPVVVQSHNNVAGFFRQRFVNAVVYNFLSKVMRRSRIGIHTRALAHRLQSG